jgi:hypothetical protein
MPNLFGRMVCLHELISFGADYGEAGTSEASVVKKRNWRRYNKIPYATEQGIIFG